MSFIIISEMNDEETEAGLTLSGFCLCDTKPVDLGTV
jgi:hypothetical protein